MSGSCGWSLPIWPWAPYSLLTGVWRLANCWDLAAISCLSSGLLPPTPSDQAEKREGVNWCVGYCCPDPVASSSVPWSCNPTVPSHAHLSLCRTSCGGCAWSFRPGCGLAWFTPCEICRRDVHRSMDPGTEPSPQMALLSHHVIPFPHTAVTTRNLSPCKVQMLQLFSSNNSAAAR